MAIAGVVIGAVIFLSTWKGPGPHRIDERFEDRRKSEPEPESGRVDARFREEKKKDAAEEEPSGGPDRGY
ncbi:MAG: hypothetical protein ACYTAF_13990 [Planctomycetota bacterium]